MGAKGQKLEVRAQWTPKTSQSQIVWKKRLLVTFCKVCTFIWKGSKSSKLHSYAKQNELGGKTHLYFVWEYVEIPCHHLHHLHHFHHHPLHRNYKQLGLCRRYTLKYVSISDKPQIHLLRAVRVRAAHTLWEIFPFSKHKGLHKQKQALSKTQNTRNRNNPQNPPHTRCEPIICLNFGHHQATPLCRQEEQESILVTI